MKYRTIVADPPWEYADGFALGPGHGRLIQKPLPYPAMSVAAICALPVLALADRECRLFLWTTNRYLPHAFTVMDSWRFIYRQTLVWHKLDANLPASVAPNSAEFVLVGVRGDPPRFGTLRSAVLSIPRRGRHSVKPEAWLDEFERISPPPRLELFARTQRLGWDTWGHEALNHVTLERR